MAITQYIIKGGKVVFSEGIVEADIYIKDGVVHGIGSGFGVNPDATVINVTGKYVLPGLMDVHVHPHVADNFEDCSEAAAFGGLTTLMHYIYVKKGMHLIEKIDDSINEGSKSSHLDFALHASLQDAENQIPFIKDVVSRGVTSFKMFMPYKERLASDKLLIQIMDVVGNLGGISMVHAEDSACEYLQQKFIAEGKVSPEYYPQSRPNQFEAAAVSRAIIFAKTVHCPLYLVHLSARESLEPVAKARDAGQTVFTETCTQYLTLTDDIFRKFGASAKFAPPARKMADVEALWSAIRTRVIDVVGTDHAGMLSKDRQVSNVFDAPPGMSGTEAMLSLMNEEGVNKKRIDLRTLVKLMSENPAKIFGLYPRKGTLQIGSDADLVVLDPEKTHTIEIKNLHGNSDFTLFEGWTCHGKPILSMQRGRIVLKDGKLHTKPGDGKYINRKVTEMSIL